MNIVNRIQNRNTGYSDGLFPKNTHIENNTLSSVEGATALKLDENAELNKSPTNLTATEPDPAIADAAVSGVSIESASYMENNTMAESDEILPSSNSNEAEYTPKLFSEEQSQQSDQITDESNETEQLFDQDVNEDEDFEIPAFLRKQKF